MKNRAQEITPIPTEWIGPISITGNVMNEQVSVPMATYETPLWPSTGRGARVSRQAGGVRCTLVDERMTRAVAVRARNGEEAFQAWESINARREDIQAVIATTSRFAKLIDMNRQIVGNLLFIRFECATGDASGHNMVTGAADALLGWILQEYPHLEYATISGNMCTDKKTSAVNGILGRGKKQVAYSKVSMNIVDVRTSRVVYSVQGAGEFLLSDREVVGFGSESGYDSTLNGKVLNLSVTDAVNKLVRGIESGEWVPDVETGGGTES